MQRTTPLHRSETLSSSPRFSHHLTHHRFPKASRALCVRLTRYLAVDSTSPPLSSIKSHVTSPGPPLQLPVRWVSICCGGRHLSPSLGPSRSSSASLLCGAARSLPSWARCIIYKLTTIPRDWDEESALQPVKCRACDGVVTSPMGLVRKTSAETLTPLSLLLSRLLLRGPVPSFLPLPSNIAVVRGGPGRTQGCPFHSKGCD